MYLVRGNPGTEKTLLGMEFLSEGLDAGETVRFIHGEESRDDIVANAAALGSGSTSGQSDGHARPHMAVAVTGPGADAHPFRPRSRGNEQSRK
ncbi:hypothetical protein GCM10009066_20350 [Halarchaeum salinum]|uniref:KaiC-like domain-containing protein n=2 Tax=Halarchaeum salinum TaxID=489912 RepID=A0AAV3S9P6_9EURY